MLEQVSGYLAGAGPTDGIDPDKAWHRLTGGMKMKTREGIILNSKYKRFLAAATAGVMLFTLFSIGPVRATAADMLKIFRVDKIQTIAINPSELNQLETLFREQGGRVDIKNFGTVESTGKITATPATLGEAGQAVDFSLWVPGQIPAGYAAPVYSKINGTVLTFNLDTGSINSMIKSMGGNQFLPGELNGKTFTLQVPNAVVAEYKKDDGSGAIIVGQSRSPEIKVPAGVDENLIKDALLSIPALPESLRKQISAINDWQHTLLIPNINGSTTEVAVNGNDGAFIRTPADGGNHRHRGNNPELEQQQVNSLVWQDGGVIYMISGNGLTVEQALSMASTMR